MRLDDTGGFLFLYRHHALCRCDTLAVHVQAPFATAVIIVKETFIILVMDALGALEKGDM